MDMQLSLFSWIMEEKFGFKSAQEYFTEKSAKKRDCCYRHFLNKDLDVQKVYFTHNPSPSESEKTLLTFTSIAAHFNTDLFQKAENMRLNEMLLNASGLPTIYLSGTIWNLILKLVQCALIWEIYNLCWNLKKKQDRMYSDSKACNAKRL